MFYFSISTSTTIWQIWIWHMMVSIHLSSHSFHVWLAKYILSLFSFSYFACFLYLFLYFLMYFFLLFSFFYFFIYFLFFCFFVIVFFFLFSFFFSFFYIFFLFFFCFSFLFLLLYLYFIADMKGRDNQAPGSIQLSIPSDSSTIDMIEERKEKKREKTYVADCFCSFCYSCQFFYGKENHIL